MSISWSSSSSRRWIAVVSAPFIALSGPAFVPSLSAASAAPPADPRPATIGAAWLAEELENGVLVNRAFGFDYYDYGLTIDAALALDAVGGQDAAVADITRAVEAGVDPYATTAEYDYTDPANPVFVKQGSYAGPMGKLLSLATSQGADVTDFGGLHLVRRMEALVLTKPLVLGRIHDNSSYGDFANVIGQSWAARGLTAAGSPLADEVTGFLLDQQCSTGWFRLSFTKSKTGDQTCDGNTASSPDTDATALSVLALLEVARTPGAATADVQAAIDSGVDWLVDQQGRSGALGGGASTEAVNSNSTGLAGWVFGQVGRTGAARKAAAWVRARQADEVSPCDSRLSAETGAIAYDSTALRAGRAEGVPESAKDQWRRATTQALPVLTWAPAGGTAQLTAPTGYVKGGSRPEVAVTGAAPGSSLCVVRGPRSWRIHAGRAGRAVVDVLMPNRTKTVTVSAKGAAGVLASATVDVLGPLSIKPRLAKSLLATGARQTVRVSDLAPHEHVTVRYRGEVVERTTAGRLGNASATFAVGQRVGTFTVKVLGEFASIRRGSADFRVR